MKRINGGTGGQAVRALAFVPTMSPASVEKMTGIPVRCSGADPHNPALSATFRTFGKIC